MTQAKVAKPDLVEMICEKLRQEKALLNSFTKPGRIIIHVHPQKPREAVEVEVDFKI